jgi:hypothetical protein
MTPTKTDMKSAKTAVKHPCGRQEHAPCGCHEHHTGCCSLICFERPNYFCGHLLTDEDLSLDVRYVVEKNKMRNRYLFGHGVVCGLKLYCDPDCKGYIRIGDGYAIDGCGNDLVVCESKPFDLIGTLLKKKLLLTEPDPDPCDKVEKKPRCEVKQCFQIVACYEEESTDYTSPFQAGCKTGPSTCLPTRIKEHVRFDVIEAEEGPASYSSKLLKQIRKCFHMFSEGVIGRYMKEHLVSVERIMKGDAANQFDPNDDYCKLFCTLQAHFLHYLKEYPDSSSCYLYHEVRNLVCPEETENNREGYRNEIRDVFCRLITLMQRYQYDCVLNHLVFSCPEPCETDCVVLGTVEVCGGRIERICHTPRKYVWSAANLEEVFYYNFMTNAAYSDRMIERDSEEPAEGCCPEYKIDCVLFLDQFRTTEHARRYVAEEPVLGVQETLRAFYRSQNWTNSAVFSARTLDRLSPENLKAAQERLKFNLTLIDQQEKDYVYNMVQTSLLHNLMSAGDPFTAFKTADANQLHTIPDFNGVLSSDRTPSVDVNAKIADLQAQIDALEAVVKQRGSKKGSGTDTKPNE